MGQPNWGKVNTKVERRGKVAPLQKSHPTFQLGRQSDDSAPPCAAIDGQLKILELAPQFIVGCEEV